MTGGVFEVLKSLFMSLKGTWLAVGCIRHGFYSTGMWLEHRKRAVCELDSLQLGRPSGTVGTDGGWQFPGTWRGLSHLLCFSQCLFSLERDLPKLSGEWNSPFPGRMFAEQLQPVQALSTAERGNSLNFLSYLQQNTRSISITEETLKSPVRLTQTLKLSLWVLRWVRIHHTGDNWALQCRGW